MMTFRTCLVSGLLAVLGGSNVAVAVCTGKLVGVGTPSANTATGMTQYKIYDSSCKNLQTLQINTANGVCDSRYFLCSFGTKNIGEYDDPTTGWSYTCTADTTSENCAGDTLTYCCTYGYITG